MKKKKKKAMAFFSDDQINRWVLFSFFWWGGFPGHPVSKESACNEGDLGSIPGLGRSLGEGNGDQL